MQDLKQYVCINCGNTVEQLYKEYSPSVLKLTKCETCSKIADKYVEYDPSIIVIDLVLLKTEAYRHVLHNTQFNFHWKLAIVLHTIEAYYEWMLKSPDLKYKDDGLDDAKEFTVNDLIFYKICISTFLKTIYFVSVIYILTILRNRRYQVDRSYKELFLEIWKCVTLSSFGLFLLVPSFIWGTREALDNSLTFVTFFTTLSQLFAYKATNNYSKGWAVTVILAAHSISTLVHHIFNDFVNHYFNITHLDTTLQVLT